MSQSYLTPSELTVFYDVRRVLELASDSGEDADSADLANPATPAYAIVMTAIRSAASDLDSHCQQGKRYQRTDLEAIIATALDEPGDEAIQKRAALLRQIIADLAFAFLMSRRGYAADRMKLLAPRYEDALALLARLAQGYQVFDMDDPIRSGVPSVVPIGGNAYRPSLYNRLFGVWEDTPRNGYRSLFGRW